MELFTVVLVPEYGVPLTVPGVVAANAEAAGARAIEIATGQYLGTEFTVKEVRAEGVTYGPK